MTFSNINKRGFVILIVVVLLIGGAIPTAGYALPSSLTAGSTPPLSIAGVSTQDVSSARLVFDMAADPITNKTWTEWRVNYQLNGGTWHSVGFSDDQLALMDRAGSYAFSIPIDLGEIVEGSNTVRFSGTNFHAGYPPYIGNIDLVLG